MNEKNLERFRKAKKLINTALEEESSWPAKNELGEIQKGINKAIEQYGTILNKCAWECLSAGNLV